MMFTFSDRPIDKLSCWIHNTYEKLTQIQWIAGRHKKIECEICGDTMDNYIDVFSPAQAGWKQIDRYTWICHNCLDHRDFREFIPMIDEENRKKWEKYTGKD